MRELHRYQIWGIKDGKRVVIEQLGPDLTMDPEIPAIREASNVLAAAKDYLDEVVQVWQGRWDSELKLRKAFDETSKNMKTYGTPPRLQSAEEARQRAREIHESLRRLRGGRMSPEDERAFEESMSEPDEVFAARAQAYYDHLMQWWRPFDLARMREHERDDFKRRQGPPFDWESIAKYLARSGDGSDIKRQFEELFQGSSREPRRYEPPSEVLKCRNCLQPSRWIWYACFPGPDCGSAGWVAICEECHTWHKERTVIRS